MVLAWPSATSGQDVIIDTTIIITETTVTPDGVASANVLQGSGTIDGGTVSTGSNSLMMLKLSGGQGTAVLGSHSSLGFGAGGAAAPGGGGRTTISVRGQVWFRLKPASKFDIKMPNAAPTIRGTTFTIEARTAWSRLRTYSGVVDIRNLRRRIRTVTVRRGRETVVRGDRPPTKPKRFRPPRRPFWE